MSQAKQADLEKRHAAAKAVQYVKNDMLLGLGSGSTFNYVLEELSRKIKDEGLNIRGVPSSERTRRLAESLHIPIVAFEPQMTLDLTIDGADEVDDNQTLIKGGGGALLREKIVAYFSRQLLIVVDSSKLVRRIGQFPLPVEVVPFGIVPVQEEIQRRGATVTLREKNGSPVMTDNGNYILDCAFGEIPDGAALDAELKTIPGVVETGIFAGLLDILVVGTPEGVHVTNHQRHAAPNR